MLQVLYSQDVRFKEGILWVVVMPIVLVISVPQSSKQNPTYGASSRPFPQVPYEAHGFFYGSLIILNRAQGYIPTPLSWPHRCYVQK